MTQPNAESPRTPRDATSSRPSPSWSIRPGPLLLLAPTIPRAPRPNPRTHATATAAVAAAAAAAAPGTAQAARQLSEQRLRRAACRVRRVAEGFNIPQAAV